MRIPWPIAAGVVLLVAGGCIARRPVAPEELDRYWRLEAARWDEAQSAPLQVGGRAFPTRWHIRQDPSLVRSTVSIVRAADRLKAGAESLSFAISPQHAAMAADRLAEARKAIENFRAVARSDTRATHRQWASATAAALADAERIVRLSSAPAPDGGAEPADEAEAFGDEPLLSLAVTYLNERSGGLLLAGMEPAEFGRLREALARMVLRLAFASAGRQDPSDLHGAVARAMREAAEPDDLRGLLEERLAAEVRDAPPAAPGAGAAAVVRAALEWGPRLLRVMEMVVRQWDRMEGLEVEFRRAGEEPVVAVTLHVAPGREVRIADLFILQPAMVFRGSSRILVLADPASGDEVAVLFDAASPAAGGAPGGAVEVRFEGIGYALVRLLALPLADADLRELRVAVADGAGGRRMVNVVLLMEARGGGGDPRRVMAFQDVRETRLAREAFEVRSERRRLEQVFNYVTPGGRFTFRRTKQAAGR
ncbi:MAG TPA: hypothetical protein VMY35_05470 [Phycisphaerae bacterium]|nr:hypothetical protein [Phycisphaerae bacterium]